MTNYQKNLLLILLLIVLLLKDFILGIFNTSRILNLTESNIINELNTELETKYQELAHNYNYTDFYPYNLEHTKILYRSPYDFNKNITIYKGTNSHITPNMLVVNEKGLVGMIKKCSLNSSEVTLLTSPDYVLPVKINEAYGELAYNQDKLIIRGIKASFIINEGDLVYTSDLSIYPEHILIGQVAKINLDNYAIEKILEIEPAVDFAKLNYVSIIPLLRGQE